uniref:Probable transport protein n=1 Tax=Xylochloris irregularis TaxID=480381 RepID=A0A097KM94_9CHLO|nr:probable transport protein [Xylochloris irregularis]AIT94297.1 probable transport protein [Xylochloris irregularis]
MSILVENVSKRFGDFQALNQLYLEIPTGSLIALVGSSGSGKSTLLRILAGLEEPDNGRIWINGRNSNRFSMKEKEIGFVFQNYALFKNMNIHDNIGYGLQVRAVPPGQISQRVKKLLQIMQLEGFDERYPHQLSGGQQQRVALARALAIEPPVLLLDEPFGALDEKVRKHLRYWLRELHQKAPLTTIFVTHDHREALEIANEVVVLERGELKHVGNPSDFLTFERAQSRNEMKRL